MTPQDPKPCFICNEPRTWYIANGKYFCKDHREEAVIAAKKETRQMDSFHSAESKSRKGQKGN